MFPLRFEELFPPPVTEWAREQLPELRIAFEWGLLGVMFGEGDSRPAVTLILNSSATGDQIKADWHAISEWNRRLHATLKPEEGSRSELLRELDDRNRAGEGPKALADRLNERIATHLRRYIAFLNVAHAAPPTSFDVLIERASEMDYFGDERARDILRAFGRAFPAEEVEDTIHAMVNQLRAGEQPYEPIGVGHVKRQLRYLRTGK